jgi:hypothetical protein
VSLGSHFLLRSLILTDNDMAGRHRARKQSIQIIRTASVKAADCKRPNTKQFHVSHTSYPPSSPSLTLLVGFQVEIPTSPQSHPPLNQGVQVHLPGKSPLNSFRLDGQSVSELITRHERIFPLLLFLKAAGCINIHARISLQVQRRMECSIIKQW